MQKALAQETKLLLETLYKPVSFWGNAAKHKVEILALLADRGDPVAIPDLALLLLDHNHSVATAAAATIAILTKSLHLSGLKWLDEAMRVRSPYKWMYPNPWAELRQGGLGRLQKLGANSVFALGLASFHFSGYVREEALRKLAEIRDGSELPYLLLRLNDWVKPVRELHETKCETVYKKFMPQFLSTTSQLLPDCARRLVEINETFWNQLKACSSRKLPSPLSKSDWHHLKKKSNVCVTSWRLRPLGQINSNWSRELCPKAIL